MALRRRSTLSSHLNRLRAAERVLEGELSARGTQAYFLVRLAELKRAAGDPTEAADLLRRALHRDPNDPRALDAWMELAGESDAAPVLDEVAVEPGAWRPQLALARERLRAGETEAALRLYRVALARAPKEADVVPTVAGDLAAAGRFEELARLLGAPPPAAAAVPPESNGGAESEACARRMVRVLHEGRQLALELLDRELAELRARDSELVRRLEAAERAAREAERASEARASRAPALVALEAPLWREVLPEIARSLGLSSDGPPRLFVGAVRERPPGGEGDGAPGEPHPLSARAAALYVADALALGGRSVACIVAVAGSRAGGAEPPARLGMLGEHAERAEHFVEVRAEADRLELVAWDVERARIALRVGAPIGRAPATALQRLTERLARRLTRRGARSGHAGSTRELLGHALLAPPATEGYLALLGALADARLARPGHPTRRGAGADRFRLALDHVRAHPDELAARVAAVALMMLERANPLAACHRRELQHLLQETGSGALEPRLVTLLRA